MRFQFLQENQKKYNIKKACKILKISRSGFYDYLHRHKSQRQIENEDLKEMIVDISHVNEGRYGSRQIQQVLLQRNVKANEKRVYRLMCEQSLIAKGARKPYRYYPNKSHYDNAVMESFYRTLKRELVQDADYDNPEQARMDIFKYIEAYYNTKRIHSALGWLSTAQFEAINA